MKKYLLLAIVLMISTNMNAQSLKGYSIGHLFHPFPNHKVNQQGIDLFDSLSPDVLRFPGGSIANKYHFYKTGYGWSKADDKRSENYIVEYVRVVNAMKTKPKTIFVMNLLDHYKGANEAALMKENMDALKYLMDNGMDVIAVELGNEFSLYNEIVGLPGTTINPELNNLDAIETGELDEDNNKQENQSVKPKKESILVKWLRMLTGKYSGKSNSKKELNSSYGTGQKSSINNAKFEKFERLAKIYHDKIQAVDSSIKTGVPVGNLKNKRQAEYNNFVLSHFDFVDAYIMHFYGSFNKNCEEGDMACLRKGIEWSMRTIVEPSLKHVSTTTDKEIWITEWNAIKFGHWGGEAAWARNSSVQIEYIKKFIDVYDKYGVQISTFHKLAGNITGANYNAIDVDKGKCYTTPVYDVLKKYYQ